MDNRLAELVAKYPTPRTQLIALLQDVQGEMGYLSEDTLRTLATLTTIPLAELSGVATFYAQFRLTPQGKHQVLVCMGTACHVNGGGTIADAVELALGVGEGIATPDGQFSWEKVACLGCCSLSPVMMVDGQAYGPLTREKVQTILQTIAEGGNA